MNGADKAMISWHMGNIHCLTSNRIIIRDFYDRMKGKGFDKKTRHEVYIYALRCHEENRKLYYFVMSGIK